MAAPDVLAFAGWNHELAYPQACGNGNGAALVGGAIVVDQYRRVGRQLLTVNKATQHEWYGMSAAGAIGTTAVVVASVYFLLPSLPSGTNALVLALANQCNGTANSVFAARVLPSGQLEAGYQTNNPITGVLTGSTTTANAICKGRWNRLDMRIDLSANPWVGDWELNGVAQPQITRALAATAWRGAVVASSTSFPVNATQVDMLTADFAIASASGAYPIGPRYSQLCKINGYGTNAGTAQFRTMPGAGAIGSTDWQRVTDQAPPLQDGALLANANDGLSVEMFGPFGSGNYLEYVFATPTLAAGEQLATVQGWNELYLSTGALPSVQQATQIFTGATSLGTQTGSGGTATTEAAVPWGTNATGLLSRVPTPAGGWDQSKLTAVKMRWRPNTNNATDGPTRYHGQCWFALELLIATADEPYPIGCPGGLMPLLGVG